MRKFLLITLAVTLSISIAYAADDDSTPYNPYPELQPQSQTQTQTKPQPKKTQAKKRPAKKKPAPRKRTSTRKKTTAKVSQPKPDLLQRAIALMEQGNYETAKRYLLRAINVNRNDPNVWYWYGKYHEYTGNFYQAQYFYSKAVKIDPSFEKLSRVVYYPNDPEKTPLWDPKRPARVYPVETSGRGVTAMTPDAVDRVTYPKVPDDPEIPKVPVYNPPEPGTSPLNGDEWAPSVYVPPAHDEGDSQARQTPVYVPPANSANNIGIIPENSTIYNEVSEIVRVNQEASGQPASGRERILRADKPLYNPPEPGQAVNKAAQVSKTRTQQVKKSEPSKKKTPAKNSKRKAAKKDNKDNQAKQEEKTAPARKTVRRQQTPSRTRTQTQPQTQNQTQTPTPSQNQTQNQNQRRQPERQQTPAPEVRQPQTQTPRPEPRQSQPQTQTQSQRQQQYMPPVGQYEPDPGTISETPMPPVGQGN